MPKVGSKVLLIDIGGTNIRTCTAFVGSSELHNENKEKISANNNIDDYLKSVASVETNLDHVVCSVAGPKMNDQINMTNRNYQINSQQMQSMLGVQNFYLLNDWESIGYFFNSRSENDIHYLNDAKPFNETALIIGPGTGLGAALISKNNTVLSTEIGNVAISSKILKFLENKFHQDSFHINEDLISGRGLSSIYKYLTGDDLSPENILLNSNNTESVQSISIFLQSFAYLLKELALSYLPGNGIFILGGLCRSLLEFMNEKNFIEQFLDDLKPMHHNLLSNIRIGVIEKEMTPLIGNLNFINSIHLQ